MEKTWKKPEVEKTGTLHIRRCDPFLKAMEDGVVSMRFGNPAIVVIDYDSADNATTCYYPIRYCPFCGEKINDREDV